MSELESPAPAAAPRPTAELLVAGLLALVAGLLYAATYQTRLFGDGPGLLSSQILGTGETYVHVLYHPACGFLERLLGVDPRQSVRLASLLPGALGVGLAYLVFRRCAAERFGALVAAGLLMLSPALWFFATTAEVHALLFGAVAALAALTLYAPWRRTGLALALVAAGFPVLHFAHQSSFVLGPGWVFLVQFARARRARPFSWPALLLGVGPLLLAALGLGIAIAYFVRFGSISALWGEVSHEVGGNHRYSSYNVQIWRDEWLLPLGLLVPLALIGFARLRRVPYLTLATATLLGVPTAFFLWWNIFENGGYFLGSALFLGIPIAHGLGRATPGKVGLALLLLAAQGTFAHQRIHARDQGWDPAERVEAVRAVLGDSGFLLSTVALAPDIRCDLPGVEEFSLVMTVHRACQAEKRMLSPEEALAPMRRFLGRLLERHERVAVDLSYHDLRPQDSPALAGLAPHLAAIEAWLREHYVVTDFPRASWPLMRLERPR